MGRGLSRLWFSVAVLLLGLWSEARSQDAADPLALIVSSRTGTDADGDGSTERPFRSVTRALAEAQGRSCTIEVDVGRYDVSSGEVFPWRVAAGTSIVGWTPESTIVAGPGSGPLIEVHGDARLVELTLEGADVGIQLHGSTASLHLIHLILNELPVGVDAAAGTCDVRKLRAREVRTRDCGVGLRGPGHGQFELELNGCEFRGGEVGLELLAPAEDAEVVTRKVSAVDCRFVGATAGIARRISQTPNRTASPYHFERCEFRRNAIGLSFELPGADSELRVIDCRFIENTQFGMKAVGGLQQGDGTLLIRGSTFQFNGVGLFLANPQLRSSIERCRVVDNIGNGLFVGSFIAPSTDVNVEDCLIGHNGASGVFCMGDGRGTALRLARCTIVGNRAAGVFRKDRRGGESQLSLRDSIAWGNQEDGSGLADGDWVNCWRSVSADSPNPGFVDARNRDYRLTAQSPCGGRTEGPAGGRDVSGRARFGQTAIGAYEIEQ